VSGKRGAGRGLVIFDCDGVLVDSEGISMRELTRALAREGGTLGEADVREQFVGIAMADVERKAAAHLGRPVPDDFIARFVAERAAAFERELRPVPGAREAIDGVREAGWEACIASGGRIAKMEQTLRIAGLRDAIAGARIFSATMVPHGKPAPDLFLHAAAVCGYATEACVVVDDSVPGVTAGCAAGMRTFGYAGGDAAHAARLASLGAEPLADMRELPALLAP
jgi:beta-phosphoglucomutase-like phosphatase (HAD superfamily)